ncbi:MAG: siphovirus ReqiPepy6 Gp37-like family protein, partial [Clostridiales Family XIII bacterium]|nr:siphovirus ReqiPepy6 Gp37-like family protein [Clostridiales Family XIII bacterium]
MDFVVAGHDRMETASLRLYSSLDFAPGESNDFEIKVSRSASKAQGVEKGAFVFLPGTEFGGMVRTFSAQSDGDEVTWGGLCWRGMLERDVVQPFAGDDYRTVSGDANAVIAQILAENGSVGEFFTVPSSASVDIPSYQFARYTTKLEGLTRMLETVGYRLSIHAERGNSGEAFSVVVEAVPIVDYSEEWEYSKNKGGSVTLAEKGEGINHLICLGKGDLKDRLRVDVYLQADGSVGTTKYYAGEDEMVAIYELTSAEDASELAKGGIERLLGLADGMELSLDYADGDDPEIGDVVGGRDYDLGIALQRAISGKIYRASGGKSSIELKVSNEDKTSFESIGSSSTTSLKNDVALLENDVASLEDATDSLSSQLATLAATTTDTKMFLAAHPVGSIYETTNTGESTAAQMASKYGGTWALDVTETVERVDTGQWRIWRFSDGT